jgi:hypothetical protein
MQIIGAKGEGGSLAPEGGRLGRYTATEKEYDGEELNQEGR